MKYMIMIIFMPDSHEGKDEYALSKQEKDELRNKHRSSK